MLRARTLSFRKLWKDVKSVDGGLFKVEASGGSDKAAAAAALE